MPAAPDPHPDAAAMPPRLYGLVLAGGGSARMRKDKALLEYHGKPQAAHAFDLLAARCGKVFLSCRADQDRDVRPGLEALPRILDAYPDLGPLAGILSALDAHPDAAWLVAACDLPYLDAASVDALVSGRDPALLATAFAGPLKAGAKQAGEGREAHGPRNREVSQGSGHGAEAPGAADREAGPRKPEGLRGRDLPDLSLGPDNALPEPLFAIYEPAMRSRLRELMALGVDCPRKAIIKSACRILPAPAAGFLANVNLPEEYRRALQDLTRSRP